MAWATTSLRRQTAVTLRGTVVLLVVLAGLCSTAVVWSAYALGSLNETAVPLQVANKEVLQDITDAETSIRGYALSGGDSGSLQPYLVAMSYLPAGRAAPARARAGRPRPGGGGPGAGGRDRPLARGVRRAAARAR